MKADTSFDCDVLVIGGGPAGATLATLMAQQGRSVVMLEKAHHPRFHVGESLLPANVELFERLGVREQIEALGMPKWGVEFVSPDHPAPAYIEFAEAWDKTMPYSWQVRRSEFDEVLFRNAQAKGAVGLEGARVHAVDFDAQGATVQATLDDGATRQWRTRFVIDASGRDTFLSNKFKSKLKYPKHNSSALFAHYRDAQRLPGRLAGNISLFWFQHGWFWFIPLADGTTSVGAVCWPYYLKTRQKPLNEFFAETLAMSPALSRRLEGATLVDDKIWATGNYAYGSRECHGERFLKLGDAYAFIDPVFSSGVYLAMASAFKGAEVVATCLDHPESSAQARADFEQMMAKGPREFSWFIHRVTNPTMRGLFMEPSNPWRVKEALLSLLAGDIFGKTPIWGSLRILKGIYYVVSVAHFKRTFASWRRRKVNIRDTGPLQGENVLEAQ